MTPNNHAHPLKERIEKAIDDFTNGRACMHVPPLHTDVDIVLAECLNGLEAAEKRVAESEHRFQSYCKHDGGLRYTAVSKDICAICGWDTAKCQHRGENSNFCSQCGEKLKQDGAQ